MMKNRKDGFTIVELLIVIVVIGILAAITIVAYNGIQTRAENAKTTATVKAFRTAFASYAVDYGTYPISSSACLGSGYPDLNSNGTPDCGSNNGTVTYSSSTTLDNALKPYGGSGTPGLKQYITGGWMQMGLMYEHLAGYTLNGVAHPWYLSYEIGGTEKCMSDSIAYTGVTLSTTPPSGWDGRSENWGSSSKCWIPLPDPSK